MYRIVFETDFDHKRFLITDNTQVGCYLYIYESGKCTYDDLQDGIRNCKEVALEDFGVPLDSWKEVDYLIG
jgi:hypothetical protein